MVEFDAERVLHVKPFLSVTAGIVVLFVGKAINERVAALREYNIPEPVTGGLLFSLAIGLVFLLSGWRIDFELTARDILLVYFFTTIGINARVGDLRAGGRPLLVLLAATAIFVVLQNATGVGVAASLGQPAGLGVLAGSVSLIGGHGTAIAWGPSFAALGIQNAAEFGIVCATMGLVLASLAGGPVARYLIARHRLAPREDIPLDVGVRSTGPQVPIDYFSFLHSLLALHIAGATGVLMNQGLAAAGLKLPLFVTCIFAGILFTNLLPLVAPRINWPCRTMALALIAEVSLGVFLAMSLMSMQLWTLASVAGPLALLLAAQLALTLLFAVLVLFRALGRDYDAAVICAGFTGFAMGATPTAMANMTAVTQRHGASHTAFLVVPLVGAFFIDLVNTAAIRIFLALAS
ncbi:MAG: sodium/glutamate symporter [Burkholderiales bacterium]